MIERGTDWEEGDSLAYVAVVVRLLESRSGIEGGWGVEASRCLFGVGRFQAEASCFSSGSKVKSRVGEKEEILCWN